MEPGGFRFEGFRLDPLDRRLSRDGAPVDLNARYLDALILLVGEHGRLVSKDRFMAEVWRGVPVTDEALTQCVRTLRRCLGDDAARPRFIETVPRYGYRFIAAVETADGQTSKAPAADRESPRVQRRFFFTGAAAVAGGGFAGALGGILYGAFSLAPSPQAGMGSASVIMVMIALTALIGLLGGAGVGFGVAAADALARRHPLWTTLGGSAGGLTVGAAVNVLGADAFNLLFGHSPGGITGAGEGAVLGAAVGFAVWAVTRDARPLRLRRGLAAGAAAGTAAGVVIALLGGRLMAGSLDRLSAGFPASRLSLAPIGRWFGETGFGPISQLTTAALEGALFSACVVGAVVLMRRRF
ncbi:MAG: transcriptional regulator [Brevundimonas sp.]|uniref:winged helix-turn-helix domain-containing protein n=1 Tax=Brevundimonas sp. TaxID=1871086 RepID=UPI002488DD0D|nr:transcriptional regulator [Brevundimonas sp.]MDI1327681.1 transcriptional regulator [Brevundimonas sp.]